MVEIGVRGIYLFRLFGGWIYHHGLQDWQRDEVVDQST